MKKVYSLQHKAFTMLELIFVIVIMGIIGKFGVEFLAQSYQGFISSNINNRLQSNSATAVEFVSSRLQYRIKPSTIAREANASFTLLADYFDTTAPVLEWIGYDIDGFRGDTQAHWSGIVDLNNTLTTANRITSIDTNTTATDGLIRILSNGAAGINDAAIYFIDPDAFTQEDDWGWDANVTRFDTQTNKQIHPIRRSAILTDLQEFIPVTGVGADNNFTGVNAFEFYQLAWSAYAVGIDDWNATRGTGTLSLWYNYQPWQGERYNVDGNRSIIMENVSSFRFIASGSIVKIQVCVKSDFQTNEDYAICKEKTVY